MQPLTLTSSEVRALSSVLTKCANIDPTAVFNAAAGGHLGPQAREEAERTPLREFRSRLGAALDGLRALVAEPDMAAVVSGEAKVAGAFLGGLIEVVDG